MNIYYINKNNYKLNILYIIKVNYVYVVNLLQFDMVKLERLVKPLNPVLLPVTFCIIGGSEVPPETCLVLIGGMLSDQIIHHLAWLTKQMCIKNH